MRKIVFDKKVVKDYYDGKFAEHLQRYFDIQVRNGIPWILSMDVHFNKKRLHNGSPASQNPPLWLLAPNAWENVDAGIDVAQLNFIFSGLYYFMLVIPQTIRKLFGEKVEYDFYRCTGWPLSSAGLGGYLHPEQMLNEACLFPVEVEYENYCAMLDIVSPFMFEEMRQFLSGENSNNLNAAAYCRLLMAMESQNEKFMNSIIAETTELYRRISGGNLPNWTQLSVSEI